MGHLLHQLDLIGAVLEIHDQVQELVSEGLVEVGIADPLI